MQTVLENVAITSDGGQRAWDTTIPARDVQQWLEAGNLRYDPDHQRGPDGRGRPKIKQAKIDQWTEDLLHDTAIFGQLTWNFRPDEVEGITFEPYAAGSHYGKLVIEGTPRGTVPDSWHRHQAIKNAVESFYRGSQFDIHRRFSVRVWSVEAAFEDVIFYAMNQQGDKADASRSKYLHQTTSGEKLAIGLLRGSPHLGQENVNTTSNTVSVRDHRVASFNTFAKAFEEPDLWNVPEADEVAVVAWLVKFWDELVKVVPSLGLLPLAERQAVRKSGSLAATAMAIHGYIRLASKLYPGGDLSVLAKLPGVAADGMTDYFSLSNPLWRDRGVVVPGSGRNSNKLIVRSSHASRRTMGEILAERCGVA